MVLLPRLVHWMLNPVSQKLLMEGCENVRSQGLAGEMGKQRKH